MVLPALLRKVHYWGSIVIALPIAIVICTGIFLQLKKDVAWIQPKEIKTEARHVTITPDPYAAAPMTPPAAPMSPPAPAAAPADPTLHEPPVR